MKFRSPRKSSPYSVWSISPILFEVGIPKFGLWMHLEMSECRILFWVTKISDFTSDSVKTLFQNMVHL